MDHKIGHSSDADKGFWMLSEVNGISADISSDN